MATETAPRRGGRAARHAEALLTGAWLGLTQVALGFALMSGHGGSATLYFALTATWLAGGAGGVFCGARLGLPLLAGALSLAAGARLSLLFAPFGHLGLLLSLAAALAAGAYAGHFLRDRAREWPRVGALLLAENNGFIVGYVAAGALLFVDARWLDGLVAGLGGALIVWTVTRARRLARQ